MLLALIILVTSLIVIVAVVGATLVSQLRSMQALAENKHHELSFPSDGPVEKDDPSPLHGLHVVLAITQDHPNLPFVDLLKEQLFALDATDITVMQTTEISDIWSATNPPDLLIKGNVLCNGYAEIYYEAEFSCSNPNGAICTLIEKPPHGDRPSNLALELITRIEKELKKMIGRDERRSALRELGS